MYIRPVTAVSAAWIVTGLDARTSSHGPADAPPGGCLARHAAGPLGVTITKSQMPIVVRQLGPAVNRNSTLDDRESQCIFTSS